MKIFCDTNIIAEFLEKRLQFEAVAKIIKLSPDKNTLFLSEGGILYHNIFSRQTIEKNEYL